MCIRDRGCGGQLAKVPQEEVAGVIEDVVQNQSWGGSTRRRQAQGGGKLELENSTLLQAQLEQLNKKLNKLTTMGSALVLALK